jgi:hypothetical protein
MHVVSGTMRMQRGGAVTRLGLTMLLVLHILMCRADLMRRAADRLRGDRVHPFCVGHGMREFAQDETRKDQHD